jgi:aminopeptidase-like protein
VQSPDDERALLCVLNLGDARASLLFVAARSGLAFGLILRAAERLEQPGLLALASSAHGNKATPDLAPM